MKIIFTLLFTVITTFSIHSQNYKQVKIYINSQKDITTLLDAGLEFDHLHLTKDKAVTVFINDEEYSILQSAGFRYEILIDDWYGYYNDLPKLTKNEKSVFIQKSKMEMNVSGFGFVSMGGFYTLSEVNAELDSMKLLYPNLITLKVSIGNSIENRPIYIRKDASGSWAICRDRPLSTIPFFADHTSEPAFSAKKTVCLPKSALGCAAC